MNTARILLALVTCALGTLSFGEDTPLRPGRLPTELRNALTQGLRVTFTQVNESDTRTARLAAVHVPASQPPTPFLAPSPFEANLSGYLKLKLKGQYKFYVEGNGEVAIQMNGAPILSVTGNSWRTVQPATVDLIKGYNKLLIRYKSPTEGAATLRVFWSSEEEGFPKEPLPAELLMHDGRDEHLATGVALRRGRELFATRRCAACHAVDGLAEWSKRGMPELATDAPSLAGVGSRLSADWISQWIANPKSMRTHVTMPHVLKGDEKSKAQQVADLTAYLSTITSDAPKSAKNDAKLVGDGEALFERLGCVSCHTFDQPSTPEERGAEESGEDPDEYDRVTLHYAGAKFQAGALAAFLREPRKHYHWSRMPDFRLSDDESAALAAFIRASAEGEVAKAKLGDATRGKKLLASAGCVQCHSVGGDANEATAFAKSILDTTSTSGCLADKPQAQAPYFAFDASDRDALRKFLGRGTNSLKRRVAAEFSQRQLSNMRCASCHQRDTTDADLPYVLDEEGVLGETPPIVPSLTWAGEKLHTDWSKPFVSGKQSAQPRHWLKIRMPAFAERGELIADGFSHEHGYPSGYKSTAEPTTSAEQAKIGNQLTLKDGGFNCQQCHAAGKTPATSPFEAPGINLVLAKDRVRYDFYRRWLLHPLRVDPITKMPKLAPDSRTTGIQEVYDGNATRQFDAIWHYIQSLED